MSQIWLVNKKCCLVKYFLFGQINLRYHWLPLQDYLTTWLWHVEVYPLRSLGPEHRRLEWFNCWRSGSGKLGRCSHITLTRKAWDGWWALLTHLLLSYYMRAMETLQWFSTRRSRLNLWDLEYCPPWRHAATWNRGPCQKKHPHPRDYLNLLEHLLDLPILGQTGKILGPLPDQPWLIKRMSQWRLLPELINWKSGWWPKFNNISRRILLQWTLHRFQRLEVDISELRLQHTKYENWFQHAAAASMLHHLPACVWRCSNPFKIRSYQKNLSLSSNISCRHVSTCFYFFITLMKAKKTILLQAIPCLTKEFPLKSLELKDYG